MFTELRKKIENYQSSSNIPILIDLDLEFTERANDFDELVQNCNSFEEALFIWDKEF